MMNASSLLSQVAKALFQLSQPFTHPNHAPTWLAGACSMAAIAIAIGVVAVAIAVAIAPVAAGLASWLGPASELGHQLPELGLDLLVLTQLQGLRAGVREAQGSI
jgi:hypothetical protein